ncbi:MAG: tetratricopeptide repeat protein [Pyrinomonadaceae bacterium]
MPTFYDSQNQPYVLTEQLGRGGEGTVYACDGDFEMVAKIYHEPVDEEKAEKLLWMAGNKEDQLLKVAAWVIDVLRDKPDGRVVGFLMPNVRAKEIHELYSLKSRRIYFPEATWHFLVHTAANLARAFYLLHRNDHIMGDVNHGNCVVLADGTVKLIDCDSYSIRTDRLRYPCEVGVTTHLAPELQGKNLRGVERLSKHDNFGLAVIIFQLLFLGRHPFAGNYLGDKDKSLEDCIREYRFAYGNNKEMTKVEQPPGTLSLSEVSPRLAAMFERAFLIDDRPSPREWIEALEDFSGNLKQCTLHPGHHYYNQLVNCPWCEIESQTGLMLFPFVTSDIDLGNDQPFNIFTVEKLISNLGVNRDLPARPPKPSVLPPPSPGILATQKDNRNRQITIVTVQFFAMVLLMALFGIGAGVFFGLCLMIFLIIFLNNSEKVIRDSLNDTLLSARQAWSQIESDWLSAAVPPGFDDDLDGIRKKIDSYQKFQQVSVKQLKTLREDVHRRKFAEHLRSFSLADSEIPGITREDCRMLAKKGVRTAAEVEENRLRHFYEVTDEMAGKLLDWRRAVDGKFETGDDGELPEEEKARFIQETSGNRRRIEKEIEHLFASLRSASVFVRKKQQGIYAKTESVAKEMLQTESDLEKLGTNSSAILALLLITFLTPFFGGIVSEMSSLPTRPSTTQTYETGTTSEQGGKDLLSAPVVPPAFPDKNITDSEIARLSEAKRLEYAGNLLIQGNTFIETQNYSRAAEKFRFGLRFDSKNVNLVNQLGYALYLQGDYDESLEVLDRALKIDKNNTTTKNFIGINYLRQERFSDARRTFTGLTQKDPDSLNGFFNLGLAQEGLKNYKAAIKAFSRAIEIDQSDADSHYELGVCLYKRGDQKGAYEQYSVLLARDELMAKRLYDVAELEAYQRKMNIIGEIEQ